MLQGMWRARTARRMLYKLLSKNVEKVWDEESKRFYYPLHTNVPHGCLQKICRRTKRLP